MRFLFLSCLIAGGLCAADSTVNGPVLGYLAHGSAIRPVFGIPGASRFGDPVAVEIARAAVSNAAGFALGCVAGELRRIDLATAEQVTLTDTCPDAIALSPTGNAAAVVARGTVQVRKGKTLEPVTTIELDATACAVNDRASLLLCSTPEGLAAVTVDGAVTRLLDSSSGAAFLTSSEDAVVAAGDKAYLLRGGTGLQLIAEVEEITAVAVLGGNQTAVVFGKSIALVPLGGGAIRTLEGAGPVTARSATLLGNGGILHLGTNQPGPAWLLVTQGMESRMMFVPQVEAANE